MFAYLEFSFIDLAKEYLAINMNLDLYEVFVNNSLPVQKLKLDQWFDLIQPLENNLHSFELFAEDKKLGTSTIYLVDIQNLKVDEKATKLLMQYNQLPVYLYSHERDSLVAEEKKLWKKAGFDYQQLKKIDSDLAAKFAQKYATNFDLDIDPKSIQKIAKNAESYQEIINQLDLLGLCENKKEMLKQLITPETLPLFMYSFSLENRVADSQKWYRGFEKEDDVQLGLSLLFTKISKENDSINKRALELIVQTDKQIKTNNKIKPLVAWKLLLFKLANL